MQFAFVIVLLYFIGDADKVLSTPTGVPVIEIYYGATKSVAATNIFMVMLALILFFALFNVFASVSRLTWAFARDRGLPFHSFFSHVRTIFSQNYRTFSKAVVSMVSLDLRMNIC
jgi:choline transport protein